MCVGVYVGVDCGQAREGRLAPIAAGQEGEARFAPRFAEPAANGTGPYERTRTMGWAARTRKTTRRGAVPRPAPLVWDARGLNRRKQTCLRPIGAAA